MLAAATTYILFFGRPSQSRNAAAQETAPGNSLDRLEAMNNAYLGCLCDTLHCSIMCYLIVFGITMALGITAWCTWTLFNQVNHTGPGYAGFVIIAILWYSILLSLILRELLKCRRRRNAYLVEMSRDPGNSEAGLASFSSISRFPWSKPVSPSTQSC